MAAVLLITVRETLEAALIISVILGVLQKSGRENEKKFVWIGLIASILASIGLGVLLQALGIAFEGALEEAFEGIIMLIAAAVITWVILWFRQQANVVQSLENDVNASVHGASGWAIFTIVFLSVFREGVELILILTATSYTVGVAGTLSGLVIGFLIALAIAYLLFNGLIRLNLKAFFQVTTILLVLFAAGLVAYGIHELNEVGWIPSIIYPVWDINHILDEKSGVGEILKIIFGYNGNPSLTEVIGYLLYMVGIWFLFRRTKPDNVSN